MSPLSNSRVRSPQPEGRARLVHGAAGIVLAALAAVLSAGVLDPSISVAAAELIVADAVLALLLAGTVRRARRGRPAW